MIHRPLTPERYYRFPWNLADNAITWLEPTTKCNMHCDGCYRENDPLGHRPLDDVIRELKTVKHLRKTDGISIAGGEPLLYPEIVELVKYISGEGWKPIIITNGTLLTPEIIKELVKAGLVGFTVHVDSHQGRPGHLGKTEEELCDLRLHLAQMIREAGKGKLTVALNATIYRDTLKDIPLLTRWAQEHMDLVQTMVYILYRSAKKQAQFDAYVGGEQVDPAVLVYQLDDKEEHEDVVAQEVVDKIREASPDYEPNAFLNGTEDPRATKWLLSTSAGRNGQWLTYMDSKFAEFVQIFHHFVFGTYMAYTRPCWTKTVQTLFPAGIFNKGLRRIFFKWLFNPSGWLQPMYFQTITIIQPPDVLDDGRISMCDGCPDSMVHEGRLVWKCRIDELQKFGGLVCCVPRK